MQAGNGSGGIDQRPATATLHSRAACCATSQATLATMAASGERAGAEKGATERHHASCGRCRASQGEGAAHTVPLRAWRGRQAQAASKHALTSALPGAAAGGESGAVNLHHIATHRCLLMHMHSFASLLVPEGA